MKPEAVTLFLVNLASIMEKADESLLPGAYKEVGASLHADPTGLGSLTLLRSIVQSACYPVAVYLAARYNRAHVISFGAFLWAGATFLVGFSSTFGQVAVSRALNGIGLAIVAPAIQSLVADSTDDNNRGTAFGWLQLTGNVGSVVGGLCSVMIAPITFMGIPGWRVSFHIVGVVSVVVGILVRIYAKDPLYESSNGAKNLARSASFSLGLKTLIQEAKSVVKIPSFQIIVAQGVTGSFPWSALSFAAMWLELIGFSHGTTAVLIGVFIVASSLGGLFGGWLGDRLSSNLPNTGRIILAQMSSASAIPLAALLLLGIPDDPSTAAWHGLVLFVTGFFISWNGPAANNPIFAEIVPEKSRTSIYALDRSFESVLSSFAPPIVGILAQHLYGYMPIPEGTSLSDEVAMDRKNAASLAKALYAAIGVPMVLCCLIYSFLYGTYPRDRERAQMQVLVECEMQQVEPDDLVEEGLGSSAEMRKKEIPSPKEKGASETDHGLVEGPDIDRIDEKSLLRRR
ncbi:spinster-like protein [Drosera capensis]